MKSLLSPIEQITPEMSEAISNLISTWPASHDAKTWRLRNVRVWHLGAAALQRGALLVYGTIGAIFFLRPDGSVLVQDPDSEETPAVETDSTWKLIAMVAAARKFPELAALLPQRPDNVRDCPVCRGTGLYMQVPCSVCRGLGWLVETD